MDESIPIRLGCEPLDTQHRLLADLIARLQKAIQAGKGDDDLAEWLEHCWAFMAIHFATEDRLMVESGYPDLLAHRADHEHALQHLRQADEACKSHIPGTAAATLQFIEEWEMDHIARHDRPLTGHLEAHVEK